MSRVLGGGWNRRTGSRPWLDHCAVPDPFMGPETRLPDWYPARQSLHGLGHTDPDPGPYFQLFSGIQVLVVVEKLPSFLALFSL